MICPKCGREVPYGSVCSCSGSTALSSNPAVNVLKTIGSSPLFLTAVILYSVSILISVFASVLGSSGISQYVLYALANSDIDIDYSVLYPMLGAMNGTSVGMALLVSVPAILVAVGMWLFFVTCRDKRTGNISTAGLTICKVISIIYLVCFCILGAVLLFSCVVVMIGGGAYASYSYDIYGYGYDSGVAAGVTAVLVFLIVICVAVMALMIAFYASVIKTINRVKACATSGMPENRIPRFLTAMLYISGVLSGLSGLTALFTSPIVGLGSLASAVCSILIAVCLGRQRQQMTILMYPPVQPAYIPVQPVQEYAPPAAPAAPAVPAPAVQEQPAPEASVSAAPEQPPVVQEQPVEAAPALAAEPVSEEKPEE